MTDYNIDFNGQTFTAKPGASGGTSLNVYDSTGKIVPNTYIDSATGQVKIKGQVTGTAAITNQSNQSGTISGGGASATFTPTIKTFSQQVNESDDPNKFVANYMNTTGKSYDEIASSYIDPKGYVPTSAEVQNWMSPWLSANPYNPQTGTYDPKTVTDLPKNPYEGTDTSGIYDYIMANKDDPAGIQKYMFDNNITLQQLVDAFNNGMPAGAAKITIDQAKAWFNTINSGGTGGGTGGGGSGGTGGGPPKTVWESMLDGINAIITGGTFDQSKWMDKYNTSLENYSTDVDSWVTAAKDANASGARGQMSQTAQDVLNEMNAKGILSSSVTGDTMSKGMSNIASQAGQQDMLAEMKGAEMKGQIPGMLGQGIQTQAALNTAALAPWKAMLDLVEVWGPKYAKDL